ncbi:hypothetical protein Trydic_g21409 [Trypoxylus dichotomus]
MADIFDLTSALIAYRADGSVVHALGYQPQCPRLEPQRPFLELRYWNRSKQVLKQLSVIFEQVLEQVRTGHTGIKTAICYIRTGLTRSIRNYNGYLLLLNGLPVYHEPPLTPQTKAHHLSLDVIAIAKASHGPGGTGKIANIILREGRIWRT